MNTIAYNMSLSAANQKSILSLQTLQNIIANAKITTKSDRLIASISGAESDSKSMTIHFVDNRIIVLNYDGSYKRYNTNGVLQTTRNAENMVQVRDHLFLQIDGYMITFERLVAIGSDIENNRIPESYNQWVANSLDGSSSSRHCGLYHVKPNYSPDNTEWCAQSDNSSHRWLMQHVLELTNSIYRISALDQKLKNFVSEGNIAKVQQYCDNNLVLVKRL